MTSTDPVRPASRARGRPGSGGRRRGAGQASRLPRAQEIHDLLERRGDSVGLSTVYRTLQKLADAGEVDMLRTEDGEAIYRRCSDAHHHHLVCRSCGATIEVEGPAVERWTRAIAAEHGYSDVRHTLEIFGTCPDCDTGG